MELIVVVALLGIMLAFSLPRLHDTLFLDENKKNSRWIIGKIKALKEAAIRDQMQYVLHFDLDSARIWETDDSMPPEAIESAALNSYALPLDMKIADIEYPVQGKINSGRADITFYKSGYTDKVLIHVKNDDTYISYLIEPFLTEIKRYEKYASFED
jgi:Tfp pilus assembly protein FimT